MVAYQTKVKKLAATSYDEAIKKARRIFHDLESQTRRKPYVRSAYFKKEKIFFDYFWRHLDQKPRRERLKRLVYLPCAIELILNSRVKPESRTNPNKRKEKFYVQIKEDTKTTHKYFMSVFPPE